MLDIHPLNLCRIAKPHQYPIPYQSRRLNYIEILRSSYYHQIENGSLEERGDLTYSLFQGLDFCEDTCGKGQQLNDWEATKVASDTRVVLANRIFLQLLRKMKHLRRGRKFELDKSSSLAYFKLRRSKADQMQWKIMWYKIQIYKSIFFWLYSKYCQKRARGASYSSCVIKRQYLLKCSLSGSSTSHTEINHCQ